MGGPQLLIIFHVSVGVVFIGTLQFHSRREPRWSGPIQFWITGVCNLFQELKLHYGDSENVISLGELCIRKSVIDASPGKPMQSAT